MRKFIFSSHSALCLFAVTSAFIFGTPPALAEAKYFLKMPIHVPNKQVSEPVAPTNPPGSLAFTQKSLAFGDVNFGRVERQTVQLVNRRENVVSLNAMQVSNSTEGSYRIVSDECSHVFLEPEQSCSLTVEMRPVKPGAENERLTAYVNNNGFELIQIPIVGSGVGAAARWGLNAPDPSMVRSVYPHTISFGGLIQDGSRAVTPATITNVGTRPTTFSLPSIPKGLEIAGVSNCGLLQPGQSCPILVYIDPLGLPAGEYDSGAIYLIGDELQNSYHQSIGHIEAKRYDILLWSFTSAAGEKFSKPTSVVLGKDSNYSSLEIANLGNVKVTVPTNAVRSLEGPVEMESVPYCLQPNYEFMPGFTCSINVRATTDMPLGSHTGAVVLNMGGAGDVRLEFSLVN